MFQRSRECRSLSRALWQGSCAAFQNWSTPQRPHPPQGIPILRDAAAGSHTRPNFPDLLCLGIVFSFTEQTKHKAVCERYRQGFYPQKLQEQSLQQTPAPKTGNTGTKKTGTQSQSLSHVTSYWAARVNRTEQAEHQRANLNQDKWQILITLGVGGLFKGPLAAVRSVIHRYKQGRLIMVCIVTVQCKKGSIPTHLCWKLYLSCTTNSLTGSDGITAEDWMKTDGSCPLPASGQKISDLKPTNSAPSPRCWWQSSVVVLSRFVLTSAASCYLDWFYWSVWIRARGWAD